MDKSSLESLIRWLEVWSAVFGVIVVVGVAGESFFGIRLLWNNWKLQVLQQKEIADLKLELQKQINLATAKAGPRRLDRKAFLDALKGKPTGTVRILYKPNDS
jgi:hypothetical protein